MSEYIDRDAAINAVYESYFDGGSPYDALKSLPAADVRPVVRGKNLRAEWPSLFTCSICGWECDDTIPCDTIDFNFCPNCGMVIVK